MYRRSRKTKSRMTEQSRRLPVQTAVTRGATDLADKYAFSKGCVNAMLHRYVATYKTATGRTLKFFNYSAPARIAVSDFVAAQIKKIAETAMQLLMTAQRPRMDAKFARAATQMVIRSPKLSERVMAFGLNWVTRYSEAPAVPEEIRQRAKKGVGNQKNKPSDANKVALKEAREFRKKNPYIAAGDGPMEAPAGALPSILATTRRILHNTIPVGKGRYGISAHAEVYVAGVACALLDSMSRIAVQAIKHQNINGYVQNHHLTMAMKEHPGLCMLLGRGHLQGAGGAPMAPLCVAAAPKPKTKKKKSCKKK